LHFMRSILDALGIDRAVGYGLVSRIWGLASGPISLLIIASRFSKEQQGFYYTFGSILALQMFFELGLTGVISTFASHEFFKMTWGDGGEVSGDPVAVQRFTDLLGKTSKWFGICSLVLPMALIPAGLSFFSRERQAVPFSWELPWILAVLFTSLNLASTPFFAVIMGSGDVVTINHRIMVGIITGTLVSWLVIWFHGGLYAVCAITFGNTLISYSYLLWRKPKLLRRAWKSIGLSSSSRSEQASISWWREIWPMQWKIALSWISGYVLFQMFNPILFHYHGSVIAGQMGLTLSASNALLGASITILNTKSPQFSMLVAQRRWQELDQLFRRVITQSGAIAASGAILGAGVIWYLQRHFALGQRFLPASQAALLLLTTTLVVMIYAMATYLRAHKREPFMYISVATAIVQGGATWYLGKHYSSRGVIIGYLATTVAISLPAAYLIWRRCRSLWHGPS
jgi:O-antigen/teichoic acid export membrane protein